MACESKKILESKVQSAAHHLKERLRSKSDTGSSQWEIAEVKTMAVDLLTTLDELWEHEEKHGCAQ